MKKSLITLVVIIPLLLTGCVDKVTDEANNLKNDVTKAYDNLAEEVDEVTTTIMDTKNKIEETAEDLQTAKEAVDEVFE